MKLTCPVCGAQYAIEAYLTDEAARRAVAVALKLPAPLAELILRYLGLFRPAAARALSWHRAARLIEELYASISSAQIARRGRTYSAPLEYWREAIEAVLEARDRLTLPLRSHGYLYEIVVGMADKTGARDESRTEAELSHEGPRCPGPQERPCAFPLYPPAGVASGIVLRVPPHRKRL